MLVNRQLTFVRHIKTQSHGARKESKLLSHAPSPSFHVSTLQFMLFNKIRPIRHRNSLGVGACSILLTEVYSLLHPLSTSKWVPSSFLTLNYQVFPTLLCLWF